MSQPQVGSGLWSKPLQHFQIFLRTGPLLLYETAFNCTRSSYSANKGLPLPLGRGSARPNPKMGAPDPENPLFLGFSVSEGD